MKTTKMPLSQLAENRANPRTITPENFQLLVNSILELPKMLEMRPVVTQPFSDRGTVRGGSDGPIRWFALRSEQKC